MANDQSASVSTRERELCHFAILIHHRRRRRRRVSIVQGVSSLKCGTRMYTFSKYIIFEYW